MSPISKLLIAGNTYSKEKETVALKFRKQGTPKPEKDPVMVNFVCQRGWAMVPRYLVKHQSACFCEVTYG